MGVCDLARVQNGPSGLPKKRIGTHRGRTFGILTMERCESAFRNIDGGRQPAATVSSSFGSSAHLLRRHLLPAHDRAPQRNNYIRTALQGPKQ